MRRFLQTCETLLALTAAWMLVFVLPFRLLVRLLARGASRAGMPSDLVVGRGLARRVMRLAPRMPFRTTCLVRAVAGWVMLRWRGVPAVVRFGVRCPAGVLQAHAWLLVGDVAVLGGEEAEGYTPIGDFGVGRHSTPQVWSDR